MAKIVNTTPGDYQTPLAPGSPSVFSVKCDSVGGMVDLSTVASRYGLTGIAHRQEDGLGVIPELSGVPAIVSLSSPERRMPFSSYTASSPDGAGIRISGGVGTTVAGVYELEAGIPVRGAVAASVTFDFDTSWTTSSRYWFSEGQLLPLYVGLEYGPTRTGLFIGFENSGTGKILAGGPFQGLSSVRPGQKLSQDLGWLGLGNHARMSVYLTIDEMNEVAHVYYEAGAAPVLALTFTLAELGHFAPSSSGYSQWRDVASQNSRLFFGHSGPTSVTVLDYELYPYAPLALNGGEAGAYHTVARRPDLPVLYRVEETGLPTSELLSRWSPLAGQVPELSSYYLPGRKSSPRKAVLRKSSGTNVMGLYRLEPHLEDSHSFMVEAVLDASEASPIGHNTGMGINVATDAVEAKMRLLEVGSSKKVGVLRGGGDPEDGSGYYLSTEDVNWADLTALRMVYAKNMAGTPVLSVYVGESSTPVISAAAPVLPAPAVPGRISIGHLDSGVSTGALGIASVTYANELDCWEKGEVSPPTGTGTAVVGSSGALEITKAFGSTSPTFYSLSKKSLYSRGMLLEFRVRVPSYTDSKGVTDSPNLWVGAGATVFFGSDGVPDDTIRKLHLGFFDCGMFGRRVAILPGAGGASDVLRQTKRGALHSAKVDWTDFHSYRLVYLPNDRVEVWVDDFTSAPAIQVPWEKFFAERDETAPDAQSVAFGFFNPEVSGSSEWEFIRSGFSTGFEFVILQDATLGGKREVQDLARGRELALVEAEDVVP